MSTTRAKHWLQENWELLVALLVAPLALLLHGGADGWKGDVFSDASEYILVGRNLFDGLGLVSSRGDIFILHPPGGPALFYSASKMFADIYTGPRLVSLLCFLGSLMLASLIANKAAGGRAATAAAALLVVNPFVWTGWNSILLDHVQLFLFLLFVLLLLYRSWAATLFAGLALAAMILVKETTMIVALAPLVFFWHDSPRRAAARLAAVWGTLFLGVFWWWAFVWEKTGKVFPANSIANSVTRDGNLFALSGVEVAFGVVLLLAPLLLWTLRPRNISAQTLGIACFASWVPAVYAYTHYMDHRQYLPFVFVGTVAIAILIAMAIEKMPRNLDVAAVPMIAAIALFVSAYVAIGNPPEKDYTPVSAWLQKHARAGQTIIVNGPYRRSIALESKQQIKSQINIGTCSQKGITRQECRAKSISSLAASMQHGPESFVVLIGLPRINKTLLAVPGANLRWRSKNFATAVWQPTEEVPIYPALRYYLQQNWPVP